MTRFERKLNADKRYGRNRIRELGRYLQSVRERDEPGGYVSLLSTRYVENVRLGGGTPSATTVLNGDYTWSAVAAMIAAGSITSAMLRDSGALSVIGRSANSVGVPGDIASTADYDVLQRVGSTVAFQPFLIENRTSDPGSPSVGQLWLRTDL